MHLYQNKTIDWKTIIRNNEHDINLYDIQIGQLSFVPSYCF